MKYGIVLLFDDLTNQQALELAAGYPGYHVNFTDNLPHLSLLHLMIDGPEEAERLERAITATGRLADAFQEIHPDGPISDFGRVEPSGGGNPFLFWRAANSPELSALHRQVVREVAPYRTRMVESKHALTPSQLQTALKWGYAHVMGDFDPHLTLASHCPTWGLESKPAFRTWGPVRLAVGEIGSAGRLTRVLREFAL